MQNIADYMGVSKNTVSLALNDKPGVSQKLRNEILQVARQLNYGGLAPAEDDASESLLVIAPSYVVTDKLFYPEIIWGIEQEARLHGMTTTLTNVTDEMQRALDLPKVMLDRAHRGIIIIGVMQTNYLMRLYATKAAMVQVDTYDINAPCHAVVTDNVVGAYQSISYLIEQGHQAIGFIGPIWKTSSNYERWMGYQYAMREHGFPVNPVHCLLDAADYSTDANELSAFVASLYTFPTAWLCANDRMATSLIHVLSAQNIRVPENVSVMGFDDAEAAVLVLPKLTTFRVRRDLMSKEAVRILLSAGLDTAPPIKILLSGELVIRDSVIPCKSLKLV
jgi:LacI family transcriptional regulator/LacI family purine nucleotide synthesis repressor